MRESRWLCFVLGVSAVLSLGAVRHGVTTLTSAGLSLTGDGIIFPDGSVQKTAAAAGTNAVPCYCDGWTDSGTKSVVSCYRADNDAGFNSVPADQYLLITDLSLHKEVGGDFLVNVGKESPGTVSVARPSVIVAGGGFPDQVHRSFRAPHIVLATGEQLALRAIGVSTGAVYIHASGFLVPVVDHHL